MMTFRCLLLTMWMGVATARLGTDPDTSCSDAYRKNSNKETCLETIDHFLRPCEYCTPKNGGESSCYNADEAKWARWFGEKCEVSPELLNYRQQKQPH